MVMVSLTAAQTLMKTRVGVAVQLLQCLPAIYESQTWALTLHNTAQGSGVCLRSQQEGWRQGYLEFQATW